MKNKMLKIIKAKIAILATVVVLCFAALQTPWFKHYLIKSFTQKLSEWTHSEISYQSFEGVIPLNFNLYKVTFSQKNETWLKVDQISLHRTLLKFVFWKNKGIDVSFIHPHLLQLPEKTKSSEFVWPHLPFQNLHVQISSYQVEINPSITSKQLPPFDLFSDLDLRKKGDILKAYVQLSSKELPQAKLSLKVRGHKNTNRLFTLLEFQDPRRELSPYLLNQALPGFEGLLTTQGSPQALFSFFHPKQHPTGSFSGSLQTKLYPFEEERSSLWGTFLGQEILEFDSSFEYESSEGLRFERIEVASPFLDLEGIGLLDRDYQLKNTHLIGHFKNLSFLEAWTHFPIQGSLDLNADLQGPYRSPIIQYEIKNGEMQLSEVIAEKLRGNGEIKFEGEEILAGVKLDASLYEKEAQLSTQLHAQPKGNYYFSDFSLSYGKNKLSSDLFKRTKETFLGQVELKLSELFLLSPFVKESLQGNVAGHLHFDYDLSRGYYEQTLKGDLEGSLVEWKDLKLENYSLSVNGKFKPMQWKSFEGDLFFQDQALGYKDFQFHDVQLLLSAHLSSLRYKVEALGPISLSSSGEYNQKEDLKTLNLFSLRGQIDEKRYLLIRQTEINLHKNSIDFTPIELKVGPGVLYLQMSSPQTLQASIKKFPLEVLNPFSKKYLLNGFLNLETSLENIHAYPKGLIEGSFSQFSLKNFHQMPPYEGQFSCLVEKELMKGKLQLSGRNQDQGFLQYDIPLSFRLYPLSLEYDTQKESIIDLNYIGSFNPFFQMLLPANHLVEGKVHMDMGLKGDLKYPKIKGSLSLKEGYYENLYLGLTLKNITASLKGLGKKVELEYFKADDALEGQVRAGGSFELNFNRHVPFHFDVKVDKGKILQFDFLDATVDGAMSFKGNLTRGKLSGKFDVIETHLNIPSRTGSSLPILPVQYVYPQKQACLERAQTLKPAIPIEYDLALKVKENAYLSGRGLNTTWQGNLDILGTSEAPFFKGKLDHVEGSFVFAGKVLNIEEGVIRFNGELAKDTTVNLKGTTEVYNARITASLQGPFLGPKLSFRSDPPYSETEILSLILFNQPVQKLTPFQAVALTHSLATLGGAYVGPDLVDQVRKGIGVDQLTFGSQVTKSGGDYMTIQVGKYITKGILVTLNRPLEMGNSPFIITAHIRGGFQLQTYFDENEISKILIQWKLSY